MSIRYEEEIELRPINFQREINLDNYDLRHNNSVKPLNEFKAHLKGKKEWQSSKDIVDYFGAKKVRTIGTNRLRIKIGGNNHRMVIKYAFTEKKIWFWLMWIGTKDESTKVDLEVVDMF